MASAITIPLRKESHAIAKISKPKIRIIHLFAPEIIQTDVGNFRQLVQRLTGKPAKKRAPPPPSPPIYAADPCAAGSARGLVDQEVKGEVIVEEERREMWAEEISGGFLNALEGGVEEEDGFFQGFGDFSMYSFANVSY